ncbi:DDE-type integrase/transposase/recombinase [Isoptericola halotolerans]|uniref:DDE-type integrase/transposase/recombinase n=1 Tax=Isoptericola halotolerans TaxID=300560 RepID=UPI00388D200B
MTPAPKKRPRSSYIRFQADQPNETWQSDFTHYRLTRPDGQPGTDVEIITWLDDHSRYALHISAHQRITAPIVLDTFVQACDQHERPASVLTDNGMVYTVRFAGRRGGRNHLEYELHRQGITQKNGRPNHPTTQGKVERFQQTMKKWLRAQHTQPTILAQLRTLLTAFATCYNNTRPHQPDRQPRPATPRQDRQDRMRHPAHRRQAPTHRHRTTPRRNPRPAVVHDHDVSIINAATSEILRELTIDLTRDYQPRGTTTDT